MVPSVFELCALDKIKGILSGAFARFTRIKQRALDPGYSGHVLSFEVSVKNHYEKLSNVSHVEIWEAWCLTLAESQAHFSLGQGERVAVAVALGKGN